MGDASTRTLQELQEVCEGNFWLALVVLQMVLQACSYKRWVFFGIETWLVKPSVFTLLELQYLMNGRLWLTIEVLRSRGSQFIHRNAPSTERAETKRACRKQRLEAEVLYEHPKNKATYRREGLHSEDNGRKEHVGITEYRAFFCEAKYIFQKEWSAEIPKVGETCSITSSYTCWISANISAIIL